MDPLELRRKNFIGKDEFPYTTPYGITYDSGDYETALDKALEMLDLDAFRAEQASLREQGILRGVGFSTYTEICGLAPSRAVGPKGFGLGIGLYESALVRVHPTGLGDGLHRRLAARPGPRDGLRADRRRPPRHRAGGRRGHLTATPRRARWASGTYGSRSLAIGGVACAHAAEKLAQKCREIVAFNFEADVVGHRGRARRVLARRRPRQDDDARRDRRLRVHRRDRRCPRAWSSGSSRR